MHIFQQLIKKIESNDKYVRIKSFITDKLTLAKLYFIIFLYQTIFKRKLVWLQEEQPLVHLLYGECYNLLRNIMLSFIKELLKDKESSDLLSVSFELQNSQKKPMKTLILVKLLEHILKIFLSVRKYIFSKIFVKYTVL